jgi:hypothetical protein
MLNSMRYSRHILHHIHITGISSGNPSSCWLKKFRFNRINLFVSGLWRIL